MTSERPFFGGPSGPNRTGDACSDSQMLSAYLDGKLDPTERGQIEDHISRCEDCYFVVRETAIALGEADEPLGAAAPGVLLGRPRSGFLSRYLLPLAAALVVGVGPIMLWRQATHVAPYSEAVRPLVEAVGERRFFEPRLTGGFKFGPTVASTRSAGTGPRSEAWAMLAVAGELRDRPAAASTGARASAAAAALFLGEVDRAVAEYSRLAMDEPTTADWPSNLAAALLVRASASPGAAERDRLEALRYAEQAVRLDPALPEARFNRSLALKALGRVEEARRGFAELAARGDGWSAAASDQLRDLPGAAGPRP